MADSVIKDRDGTDVEYTGVTKIKLNTVDGGTQIFSEGEAVEGVEVSLDFSNGDQTITAPDGKLVKSAIIKKPDTLVPENIALDTIVAGVVGTFESGNFNTDNLVEIVPVTFVTVPSGGDGTVPLMQPIGLKTGSVYQILWNNVSYILEAKDITYNGIPAVAVGNGIAWGGEDNGLPFAIGEIPEEYVSFTGGAYGLIIPLDGYITFKVGGYLIRDVEKLNVNLDFSEGNITVVPEAGKLINRVDIQKPATLVPENIAKDVNVAGVVGTHEGGGVPRLKPIRFYDPYGNVLYSFTRAEIKEMTELPPGPELGNLTFSKWTHTLAELKAVPYFADVGPCYKQNGSDVIVLIVDIYYSLRVGYTSQQSLYLSTGTTNKVTVNWGDGSSSTQGNQYYISHTYTNPGRYIVTVKPSSTSAKYLELGHNLSNYYYQFAAYSYSESVYNANINKPVNLPLVSVLSGLSIPLRLYGCTSNAQLKMFSSFSDVVVYGYGLMNNPNLEVVCAKSIAFSGNVGGARNLSLKRYPNITNIAYNLVISECRDLEEVIFGYTPDKLTNMNDQWAMLMTLTEPPTLTADTVRTWGTKPIYVPDSAVEAYKTADVWSTVADYIHPASQYPD